MSSPSPLKFGLENCSKDPGLSPDIDSFSRGSPCTEGIESKKMPRGENAADGMPLAETPFTRRAAALASVFAFSFSERSPIASASG